VRCEPANRQTFPAERNSYQAAGLRAASGAISVIINRFKAPTSCFSMALARFTHGHDRRKLALL
jgi:hypothetical protein